MVPGSSVSPLLNQDDARLAGTASGADGPSLSVLAARKPLRRCIVMLTTFTPLGHAGVCPLVPLGDHPSQHVGCLLPASVGAPASPRRPYT
eukprot:scaffold14948_cov60-Phaeocystis_antarctica.AAC.2